MKLIAFHANRRRRREEADSGILSSASSRRRLQHGSVLIIVLWIALGLVAITLYFANAMSSELRAADNRVAALVADQAIEGAARYVTSVLTEQATNGIANERQEAPCRVVRPVHPRGVGSARDNRADESGLADFDCYGVSSRVELRVV